MAVESWLAPPHVISVVERGLLDRRTWLDAAVMVRIPMRRRDGSLLWPAAFLSAFVERDSGAQIGAVWVVGNSGEPIASVSGSAVEFTRWPLLRAGLFGTTLSAADVAVYPEYLAAQLVTMSVARSVQPFQT